MLHNETQLSWLFKLQMKKQNNLKGLNNKRFLFVFVPITERSRSRSESTSSHNATGLVFLLSISRFLSATSFSMQTLPCYVKRASRNSSLYFYLLSDSGGKIFDGKYFLESRHSTMSIWILSSDWPGLSHMPTHGL